MVKMPAFCDKCSSVFPSGIEINNSLNVTIKGCKSRCPICGETANIPDGTYNIIGNTIEILKAPNITIEKLIIFRDILAKAKKQNEGTENIKKEVENKIPELSKISDVLPKTRSDLYAFITIILTFIQLMISLNSKEAVNNYNAGQIINNYYISSQNNTRNIPHSSNDQINSVKSNVVKRDKIGRNKSCPCGSGLKYKKCCGAN